MERNLQVSYEIIIMFVSFAILTRRAANETKLGF